MAYTANGSLSCEVKLLFVFGEQTENSDLIVLFLRECEIFVYFC